MDTNMLRTRSVSTKTSLMTQQSCKKGCRTHHHLSGALWVWHTALPCLLEPGGLWQLTIHAGGVLWSWIHPFPSEVTPAVPATHACIQLRASASAGWGTPWPREFPTSGWGCQTSMGGLGAPGPAGTDRSLQRTRTLRVLCFRGSSGWKRSVPGCQQCYLWGKERVHYFIGLRAVSRMSGVFQKGKKIHVKFTLLPGVY